MPKISLKDMDPELYARVKDVQARVALKYDGASTVARVCPYCGLKLSILADGQHGAERRKCPDCGEILNLPPVNIG